MASPICVPRLGWSMEEGVFLAWLQVDGATVAVGDPLFEIEGDKATQAVEAVEAGQLYIGRDGPQPGQTVLVGAVLGYLLTAGESPPSAAPAPARVPASTTAHPPSSVPDKAHRSASKSIPQAAPTLSVAPPSVRRLARQLGIDLQHATAQAGRATAETVLVAAARGPGLASIGQGRGAQFSPRGGRAVASPRARRVAGELGIDWTSLTGGGQSGRVREADVRAAADRVGAEATANRSAATDPAGGAGETPLPADWVALPVAPRRQAIAARMRRAVELSAPVTLWRRVDASGMVALGDALRATARERPVPGINDLLLKLLALVLPEHRQLAVCWQGGQLLAPSGPIPLCLAVDAPDGLLAPRVPGVADANLWEIARRTRAVAERARERRLTPADLTGGAFTLSNLGAWGVEMFTPIVNYPQVAILGVGALDTTRPADGGDALRPVARLPLSLTFDHAAVDGAPAARFLNDLAQAITAADQRLEGWRTCD